MNLVGAGVLVPIIGGAVGALAVFVALWFGRKESLLGAVRSASLVLFAGWVIMLLNVTGVAHAPALAFRDLATVERSLNLVPFVGILNEATNINRALGVLNIAGNVAMFVPVGFLAVLGSRASTGKVLLTGCALSVAIEGVQFLIGRQADIDDVVLNTLGTALGVGAARLMVAMFRSMRRHAAATTSARMVHGVPDILCPVAESTIVGASVSSSRPSTTPTTLDCQSAWPRRSGPGALREHV